MKKVEWALSKRYGGYRFYANKDEDPRYMEMSAQFICTKALGKACIRSRLKNKIRNALGIAMTKDIGKKASASTTADLLRPFSGDGERFLQ